MQNKAHERFIGKKVDLIQKVIEKDSESTAKLLNVIYEYASKTVKRYSKIFYLDKEDAVAEIVFKCYDWIMSINGPVTYNFASFFDIRAKRNCVIYMTRIIADKYGVTCAQADFFYRSMCVLKSQEQITSQGNIKDWRIVDDLIGATSWQKGMFQELFNIIVVNGVCSLNTSEAVDYSYTKMADIACLEQDLDNIIKNLTPREQVVIKSSFGLKTNDQMKQTEIAAILGCHKSRITQIEAKALRKLRKPANSKMIKEYI